MKKSQEKEMILNCKKHFRFQYFERTELEPHYYRPVFYFDSLEDCLEYLEKRRLFIMKNLKLEINSLKNTDWLFIDTDSMKVIARGKVSVI